MVDQRPLHQRVWEVEREREHRLRLLVAEKEERDGVTFAPPPLGRVSERLVSRDARSAVAAAESGIWEGDGGGGRRGRLITRLQEQAMWARERRRLRVQAHEEVCVRFVVCQIVCLLLRPNERYFERALERSSERPTGETGSDHDISLVRHKEETHHENGEWFDYSNPWRGFLGCHYCS